MALLEVKDITYTYYSKYQKIPAIRGISCSFEKGRIYAIMGSSGSGKTTLLSLLAGLDLPETGEILYDGKSTKELDRDKYRREHVSVIYQSFNLFPLLNALENVTVPMRLNNVGKAESKARAKELLNQVGLPKTIEKQLPKMMSGGEQQRVAIARALASDAGVILADEPTGNLDSENGENIITMLKDLAHNENRCVVVITHDAAIAQQSDVIYKLLDGKLI